MIILIILMNKTCKNQKLLLIFFWNNPSYWHFVKCDANFQKYIIPASLYYKVEGPRSQSPQGRLQKDQMESVEWWYEKLKEMHCKKKKKCFTCFQMIKISM